MSRRRSITTLISVDKRVRKLSDSAALLYTWMIPHAEEDATIDGDPEELAAMVFPNRPAWNTAKMERCCREITDLDLATLHEGRLYFPPEPFYRIQSNIHLDKRRTWHPSEEACKSHETAENSGEQRETAENSASFSPSPSLSKHMSGQPDVSVFNHWVKRMGKTGRVVFDDKRRGCVKRALKVLTPEECLLAIEGCAITPHNAGQNAAGVRYDDLTLIFRDASHWERFIATARKAGRVAKPPPEQEREPEITPEDRMASIAVLHEARKRSAVLAAGGRDMP